MAVNKKTKECALIQAVIKYFFKTLFYQQYGHKLTAILQWGLGGIGNTVFRNQRRGEDTVSTKDIKLR